jgi:hypothetical protein
MLCCWLLQPFSFPSFFAILHLMFLLVYMYRILLVDNFISMWMFYFLPSERYHFSRRKSVISKRVTVFWNVTFLKFCVVHFFVLNNSTLTWRILMTFFSLGGTIFELYQSIYIVKRQRWKLPCRLDMRSFLSVSKIITHSVEGRIFHVEISYAYLVEVLCVGCARKNCLSRERTHLTTVATSGVCNRISWGHHLTVTLVLGQLTRPLILL